MRAAADELSADEWLLVDFDAEQVWLPRFIADDTFNSPNQYISAMNAIRTCSSWMLRDAAWKEIQRLGLPPVKVADRERREKVQARLDKALAALRARMYASGEGSRKGSGRVSKPSNANANANADEDEPPGGLFCTNGCDREAVPGERACEECLRLYPHTGGIR